MEGKLATGRIRKPHGVKGYLKIQSFSGETAHLKRLRTVHLENEGKYLEYEVEDQKGSGSGALIKLKGINNPEEAKQFVNWIIWVDRKKAAVLKKNEYYAADLIGSSLIVDSNSVGEVKSICETDADTLIEVKSPNGECFLLPFAERYFGKVDLKKRQIEFKEPRLLE